MATTEEFSPGILPDFTLWSLPGDTLNILTCTVQPNRSHPHLGVSAMKLHPGPPGTGLAE